MRPRLNCLHCWTLPTWVGRVYPLKKLHQITPRLAERFPSCSSSRREVTALSLDDIIIEHTVTYDSALLFFLNFWLAVFLPFCQLSSPLLLNLWLAVLFVLNVCFKIVCVCPILFLNVWFKMVCVRPDTASECDLRQCVRPDTVFECVI